VDVGSKEEESEPSEDELAKRAVREDAIPARPSNAELGGFGEYRLQTVALKEKSES